MPALSTGQTSNKPIWYFLLFWTLLNAVQSYTLELHGDEAYYWMYSRFLDWGYFDHPPMVAIFIRIGDSVMHNELGLRLLTVITNSASIYLIWLCLKRYAVDARWFIALASGLFIFHIYGFTTTPDSPLFFFTALFYYLYQKYANEDKWDLAVALGVVAACLLYSKYHGLLVILFTLSANIRMFRRKSFWLTIVLAGMLFTPHVLWEIAHDFPSLRYHLVDRSEKYDIGFTLIYPLGQLAMAGPLIGWFLFYRTAKVKITDVFIRTLVVNCIGTFLFFWLNTLKGNVQLHWTLIAYVPLLMLVLIAFKQSTYPPSWFLKLTVANTALIIFVRMSLMFQLPYVMQVGQFESYFGFHEWTKQVHKIVGDHYVIIRDGFQDPSKYNYYTNSLKAMSYDTRYYRKTQYDLWPIEDSIQHKKAFYMSDVPEPGATTDSLVALYGRKWYTGWVDSVRTYQKTDMKVIGIKTSYSENGRHETSLIRVDKKMEGRPGQEFKLLLDITSPYETITNLITAARINDFSNTGKKNSLYLEACFLQDGTLLNVQQAGSDFNRLTKNSYEYLFTLKAPLKKGKYSLLFSMRTTPFPGSRNSDVLEFTAK